MVVTFKQPPLNEVALGMVFLQRPDLLIPHIGSFWPLLRDDYPRCQHASPAFDGNEPSLMTDLPLPRVWFISGDDSRLVQVQQDRIVFNWRSVPGGPGYCRFPQIQAEFERVSRLFNTHVVNLTGQPVHPASYTLAYVNHIPAGDGWSPGDDMSAVFPDLQWGAHTRFLPRPRDVRWGASFPLPSGMGSLKVNVAPARVVSTNTNVLKFELTANSGSLGGSSVAFDAWVSVAHEWVVRAFKDLTSEGMHSKFWLLEPEDV